MQNPFNIAIYSYTIQELAVLYHVQAITMRRWLEPFNDEIGKPEHFENGTWKFSERQVEMIVSKLQPQNLISICENFHFSALIEPAHLHTAFPFSGTSMTTSTSC